MREIKFRCWDVENKKMLKSHEFNYSFLQGVDFTYFIPMQFTGLLDKFGKEIYEGDIVKFGDNVIHENTHGKVIWSEKRVSFIYEFIDGQYKGKCTDMIDSWRTYEIIGNIYENPELLKK